MSKVKPNTTFEKYLHKRALEVGYNKDEADIILLTFRTMIRIFKKIVKVFKTHFLCLKERLCVNIFSWFSICTVYTLTFRERGEYMKHLYKNYYHRYKNNISEKKREILTAARRSRSELKIYRELLKTAKVIEKPLDVNKHIYADYYFNVYKKQNESK